MWYATACGEVQHLQVGGRVRVRVGGVGWIGIGEVQPLGWRLEARVKAGAVMIVRCDLTIW